VGSIDPETLLHCKALAQIGKLGSGTLTRNGRIAALSAECARWCVAIVSINVLMGISYRAERLCGIRERGKSGELTEPAALALCL
jgi:hypothetical protein